MHIYVRHIVSYVCQSSEVPLQKCWWWSWQYHYPITVFSCWTWKHVPQPKRPKLRKLELEPLKKVGRYYKHRQEWVLIGNGFSTLNKHCAMQWSNLIGPRWNPILPIVLGWRSSSLEGQSKPKVYCLRQFEIPIQKLDRKCMKILKVKVVMR